MIPSTTICGNCKNHNTYNSELCSNCGYLIRDKVPNIDLFSSITDLFYKPGETFRNIVFATHKNYIFVLFLIASIKIYFIAGLYSFYTSMPLIPEFKYLPLGTLILIIISLVVAFFLKFIYLKSGLSLKVIDYFSIISYSLVPLCISAVLLIPLEFIVFGEHFFSLNPSPIEIKPLFVYVFLTLESGFILWSFFLLIIGVKTVTSNTYLSIETSFFYFAIVYFLTFQLILNMPLINAN